MALGFTLRGAIDPLEVAALRSAQGRQRLRSKGVGDEAIAAAFRAAGADGSASIERIWRSRFSQPPLGERERARQVRFLQGRGFPLDDILKFLREDRP